MHRPHQPESRPQRGGPILALPQGVEVVPLLAAPQIRTYGYMVLREPAITVTGMGLASFPLMTRSKSEGAVDRLPVWESRGGMHRCIPGEGINTGLNLNTNAPYRYLPAVRFHTLQQYHFPSASRKSPLALPKPWNSLRPIISTRRNDIRIDGFDRNRPFTIGALNHSLLAARMHASSDTIRAQCTQKPAPVPLPRGKEEEEEEEEEEGDDFDSQDLDEFVGQGGEDGDEEEDEEEEKPVAKQKKVKVRVSGSAPSLVIELKGNNASNTTSLSLCPLLRPLPQKVHVDDEKDNIPAAAKAAAGGSKGFDVEPAVTGADGVERQLASVSGIMSSADFASLNLTPNTQKVLVLYVLHMYRMYRLSRSCGCDAKQPR